MRRLNAEHITVLKTIQDSTSLLLIVFLFQTCLSRCFWHVREQLWIRAARGLPSNRQACGQISAYAGETLATSAKEAMSHVLMIIISKFGERSSMQVSPTLRVQSTIHHRPRHRHPRMTLLQRQQRHRRRYPKHRHHQRHHRHPWRRPRQSAPCSAA